MAERWQQWMPFHIDRFRGSPEVQAMHPIARIGYLYLLSSAWQTDDCTIPCDELDLAAMSGLGDDLWAQYKARIIRKFPPVGDGTRLQNAVLFAEWSEAKRIFEARSAAAKKTTEIRSPKEKPMVTAPDADGDRTVTERRPSRSADTITGTGTTTETTTKATTLASTAGAAPAASLPIDRGDLLGTLPCTGGFVYEVRTEDLARDGPLYPGVDVAQEYREMKGWLLADPKRQKTKTGIRRFMASWLAKAQNESTRTTRGTHGKPTTEEHIASFQRVLDTRAAGRLAGELDRDGHGSQAGIAGPERIGSLLAFGLVRQDAR